MKKNLLKLIVICALAACGTEIIFPAQAEDKPAASSEVKKERAIPFNGKINEIDKTAKTISIGKEKKRTIHITAKTRIMKAGKTATLEDAAVGADVGGTYRESADGKLEAVSLRIGLKPEGEAKAETKKKKE